MLYFSNLLQGAQRASIPPSLRAFEEIDAFEDAQISPYICTRCSSKCIRAREGMSMIGGSRGRHAH